MKTGLLFRDYEEAELNKVGNCIFLGNEGCIYKVPNKNEIINLKTNMEEIEIHIITPLISQINLQLAKDKIDELISTKLIDSITFNDYGLLYYTVNKYKSLNIKYYLGRLLTKSFSDCPWSDHLNRNEEETTQKYMNGFVLNDPRKIEMFKEMGIVGVHLSVSKKNIEGIHEISQNGFEVIVHLNTIIGSASRICSQAQYHTTKFPDCKDICKKPNILKLSKLWSLKEGGYVDPSEEVKQIVPQYYVAGNITYYRNPDSSFLLDRADLFNYGIIDYDFESQ